MPGPCPGATQGMTPMTVELSARFSVSNTGEIHANLQERRPCMKRLPRDREIIKTSSKILQKNIIMNERL
jgi:hypothetical protein